MFGPLGVGLASQPPRSSGAAGQGGEVCLKRTVEAVPFPTRLSGVAFVMQLDLTLPSASRITTPQPLI